ncbi:MAG: hypothetical protein ACLGGX_09205 [Bdellovibrionia bacterium]
MKVFIFLLGLIWSLPGHAGVMGLARYDVMGGEEIVFNRLFLKGHLGASYGALSFFGEGFFEANGAAENNPELRLPNRGYLQESFVELKLDSIFLKAGRFANRWSEMWVLPSLDIWTGRRWNRLLMDDFSDQLVHSTGAMASIVWESGVLDFNYSSEIAQSEYPEPLPFQLENEDSEKMGYGLRLKQELGPVGVAVVAAQVGEKQIGGVALNVAFEQLVLKSEVGGYQYWRDDYLSVQEPKEDKFVAIGTDIFVGNFTLTPQMTFFDFGETGFSEGDYQTIIYSGILYSGQKHELFLQGFFNSSSEESFVSAEYNFNWNDWLSLGGYVQHFSAEQVGLWSAYKNITGGTAAGLKITVEGSQDF